MPDMLVHLPDLPESPSDGKIVFRRANTWDTNALCGWVLRNFSEGWADCVEVALKSRPVTCFIAVEPEEANYHRQKILGFACYDVAGKGVFGPMGVKTSERKRGLGAGVLIKTLHAMREEGYAYGIIGQIGPEEFYRKTVGATLIQYSDPGSARVILIG